MIHRGEIVERVVRNSGIPLTRIAARMNRSRRWIYNAFETSDLSLDLILEFGKILHYDFSADIPQIVKSKSIVSDVPVDYDKENVQHWKDKYYQLLEEHNELLKKLSEK